MVSSWRTLRWGRLGVAVLLLALAGGVGLHPSPVRAASRPTLALVPDAGPPGTTVTLAGRVPAMTAAPPPYMGVTVCLGGCAGGFTETSVPVRWLGEGRFTARFTVPAVPVLTARGPLVLGDGPQRIGFTCIGPDIAGCAARTMAWATFTVRGSHETACTGAHACAALVATPSAARAGQRVDVTGFAPLSPVIGQPLGYELVLETARGSEVAAQVGQVRQRLDGRIQGSFRMPALVPGLGPVPTGPARLTLQYQFDNVAAAPASLPAGVTILDRGKAGPGRSFGYELLRLAPTPFTVDPLPAWAALGTLAPEATRWGMALPLAHRAGTAGDFAYCVPGGIRLTTDGGRTWSVIATQGAAVRSMSGGFPIAYGLKAPMPHATCQSLLWDPNDPRTLYASFLAIRRRYASAPPLYSVLYETRNLGRSWRSVPVPAGYSQGDFGGMRTVRRGQGRAVEVVFGHRAAPSPRFPGESTVKATAELSADGGARWRVSGLSCPARGPCVRFGAMPGMLPGMGAADLEPLVTSSDGGKRWHALRWPAGDVMAQGLAPGGAELAWLGGNRLAFVDAASQYPLRVSSDGGRSWQAVALPPLPGGKASGAVTAGASPAQVLMLLPGGTLLAGTGSGVGVAARWWVLSPGARRWVADRGITAPTLLGRLLVANGRLDWLEAAGGGLQGPTITGMGSAPLPGTSPGLPEGFASYGAARAALMPRLKAMSAVTVLLPRRIPHDGELAGTRTTIDAAYRAGRSGYRFTLFYGRPLPVNSPDVGESGNAGFLMQVTGAPRAGDLDLATTFGPISARMRGARAESVSLGHGVSGTLFTAERGAQARTSASWSEDGWQIVIPPTAGTVSPLEEARSLAAGLAGLRLPGRDGTAVFAVGSDAPSIAVFRSGHAWYALYANGWRAARFAAAMAP